MWILKVSDVNLSPLSTQGLFPAQRAAPMEPLFSYIFLLNYIVIVPWAYNNKLDFARLKWFTGCPPPAVASWKQQVSPGALQQKHWLLTTLPGIKHFHALCFSHVKAGFYHDISLPICTYSKCQLQLLFSGLNRIHSTILKYFSLPLSIQHSPRTSVWSTCRLLGTQAHFQMLTASFPFPCISS